MASKKPKKKIGKVRLPDDQKTKGQRWAAIVQAYCLNHGWPEPEAESRFHPERMWRWDLAFQERKLAVEFQGGVWTFGGHNRGKGYTDDCEKYSAGAVLGWRLIQVTYDQLETGSLWPLLETEFKGAALPHNGGE